MRIKQTAINRILAAQDAADSWDGQTMLKYLEDRVAALSAERDRLMAENARLRERSALDAEAVELALDLASFGNGSGNTGEVYKRAVRITERFRTVVKAPAAPPPPGPSVKWVFLDQELRRKEKEDK
jgi:hypothetical protein